MEKRVYNFSPGPAVLPLPALQEAQRDLLALPGTGISILEISHRSKAFDKIINQAEANLRTLLGIPNNYRVLFLQGGALLAIRHGAHEPAARHAASRPTTSSTAPGARRPPTRPRPKGPSTWPGTAKRRQLQPRSQAGRAETRPQRAPMSTWLERDDPGRAVPDRARGGRRAVGVRCVVRLPLPAGGDREVRHPVRLRPEERRPGGRDDRHHPRRSGRPVRRPICRRWSTTRCWPRASRC